MIFEEPSRNTPSAIDGTTVDQLDDSDLDRAPFGIICLDAEGTILRYNLYESRLARLDRNQVLGRDFFGEVARCARGPQFEGRFRRLVEGADSPEDRRFDYVFDFAFGAQQVTIELHRAVGAERYYLFVNRRSAGPARPEATEIAASQSALAPNEASLGLHRDEVGRRYVDAPATLFSALRATFNALAPEAWSLFAGEWGVQWGRRVAIELEADTLEASACALEDLPMRAAAQRVGEYLERRGWGSARFDFSFANEGIIAVHVVRSVLAESAAPGRARSTAVKERSCALLAGVFSGAFTHLAGRKLVAREFSCRASGDAECSFALVSAERTAALDDAIAGGARAVAPVREALRRPWTRSRA